MRKDKELETKSKKSLFYFFGLTGIVLMAWSASSRDLGVMLIALAYSTGIGAYLLSSGIEAKQPRQATLGAAAILGTGIGIVVIFAILALQVYAVVVPVSNIAIDALATAAQVLIDLVCLLTGW